VVNRDAFFLSGTRRVPYFFEDRVEKMKKRKKK